MSDANCDPSKDPFITRFIRKKVWQIVGQAGYQAQDVESLTNAFLTRVVQALQTYEPSKGHLYPFIQAVIDRFTINVLRDGKAAKHGHGMICSLNIKLEIEDDGPIELGDTVSEQEQNARLGRSPRNEHELAQLKVDLDEQIKRLPDDLRELAERLKYQSIAEAAREMGVPRTSLYESVKRIRKRFESAGLKDYV